MSQALDERPLLVRLKARIDKYVGATTKPLATDIALHQQSADEIAKLELELKKAKNLIKEMDLLFGRNLLAMRCAIIEWDRGAGAKAGMSWIYNTLRGPGELPPQRRPTSTSRSLLSSKAWTKCMPLAKSCDQNQSTPHRPRR